MPPLTDKQLNKATKAFLESHHIYRKGPSGMVATNLEFSEDPEKWRISTQAVKGALYDGTKRRRANLLINGVISPEWGKRALDSFTEDYPCPGDRHIALGYVTLDPPEDIESLQLVVTANLYRDFHLRTARVLRFDHAGFAYIVRVGYLNLTSGGLKVETRRHADEFRSLIAAHVAKRMTGNR